MYGASTYSSHPYAGYLSASLGVGLGIPVSDRLWNLHSYVILGPGVYLNRSPNQIVGETVVTGLLLGGTYIPPPPPGPPVTNLVEIDLIETDSQVTATMSGGRAVTSLVGYPVFGRTFLWPSLSGGSSPRHVFLRPDPSQGITATVASLDGGDEGFTLETWTDVTGDLSGGSAQPVTWLDVDVVGMFPSVSSDLSGGQPVVDLAGHPYLFTGIRSSLSGGRKPGRIPLRGRIYTQPVITGNLRGGTHTRPGGGVTGGGRVLSTDPMYLLVTSSITVSGTLTHGTPPADETPPDLPPLDGQVGGAALVDLLELVGIGANGPASEVVVQGSVHLYGDDAHSLGSPLDFPIRANSDGSPSYSVERWLRVRFTPPFGEVSQFRFWVDPLALPFGWNITWGWADTYHVPSTDASTVATLPLPQFDPGSANVGNGLVLDGRQVRYSPYLVLQAVFAPESTVPGDLVEPLPGLTYNFAFQQG